jgi:hypothetical protein
VVPGPEENAYGSCFAAVLVNTWTTPVTIRADYGGTPLSVAQMARTPKGSGSNLTYEPLVGDQLAPRQVAILFLSQFVPVGPIAQRQHFVECPRGTQPGTSHDAAITDTGTGKSFHITTSAPVAAYDIYPYGGGGSHISSATILIPTSAWGTNYMAVDAYPMDPAFNSITDLKLAPFVQIVAAEDDTKVTINPVVPIIGGPGVTPAAAGRPQIYNLSRGEVLQFLQPQELAGSPIVSDKPIGVWGGSSCMRIPVGVPACDAAHQQILPVTWLGSEYVAVRYGDRLQNRAETVPWTFVGAVDGTVLTYDPAPPTGAPATLKRGDVVRFDAAEPFVVRSNDLRHPFYVAGHMTGASQIGFVGVSTSPDSGDPEYVNAVPPQQWLPSYIFLTDGTYKHTHLVFIRQKGTDQLFKDVMLDCLGNVTGWKPVGSAGQFEFARVDFDKQPSGCLDGAHTARSDAPFGLTVWGWDDTVSYAYPAGLSTRPINTVVVPVVVE